MSKNYFYLSFLVLFSSSLLHAESLETKFSIADKAINLEYKTTMQSLSQTEKDQLKKEQREWIEYKEYTCSYQKEVAKLDPKTAQEEYLKCLIALTDSRTEWLKAYKKSAPELLGKIGLYSDSFGGDLKIISKNKESFKFDVSVVRGATAHTGQIIGIAKFKNESHALYQEQSECVEMKSPCCQLDFKLGNVGVEITETNCSYLHGARAYFDGLYVKVKD